MAKIACQSIWGSFFWVCLAIWPAWAAVSPADYSQGIAKDGSLNWYVPGLIRPDAGTIEVTVEMSKPIREFGNNWEFLFSIPCGVDLKQGGNTLFGAYIPPEPSPPGMMFLIRSSNGRAEVFDPTFAFNRGDRFHLAFSWGKALRFYVNGVLKAQTPWNGPVEERLFSPFITFERGAPYHINQIRISTQERSPKELATNPKMPLAWDPHTVLLSGPETSDLHIQATPWHLSSGYAFVIPMLRTQAQCFNAGDAVSLPLLTVNYARQPATRKVTCLVQDADGKNILEKEMVLEIACGGRHQIQKIDLSELREPGYYPVKLTISENAKETIHSLAVAVIQRQDDAIRPGKLAEYYGQHIHPQWDTSVWQRMGVRHSRAWSSIFTFLWWSIEPVKGEYDFSKSDAYVQQCRDAGIDVLGVLGYPSRWAAIDPGEEKKKGKASEYLARPERWRIGDMEAWKRYVYETVKRYRGQVHAWEIYNEVNFHPPVSALSFGGTTQDYFELLKAAYIEAKRANPEAKIVISGFTAAGDRQMPYDLLAMGAVDYFDVFAFHGYGGKLAGNDAQWVAAYRQTRPDGPYWQTEQMWHTISDDKIRSFKTVETYVDFLAGGCERFFNMGDMGIFFDRATQSPRIDYAVIAGIHQNIRSCDSYEGKYSFPGNQSFALNHYFKHVDGGYLSVLGSMAGEYSLTVSGDVTSAADIIQRPVEVVRQGPNHTFVVRGIVYVRSRTPLKIQAVNILKRETNDPHFSNPGFEQLSGDDILDLSGCAAVDWTVRDRKFDPQGTVKLSKVAHSGRFAVSLTSSGKGPVYLFQETSFKVPGKYRISACFRSGSGNGPTPYLFVLDNNNGRLHRSDNRMMQKTALTDRYQKYEFTVDLEEAGSAPMAVGVGIAAGQGELLVDDVKIQYESP